MSENIIELKNISMMFNLGSEKVDNLKEYVIKLIGRKLMFNEFWALTDVSLNIRKGESLGILGLNGSGKSTLLKIIAGIMKPTKGAVVVNGTISPLIELGAGFDPDLSARENVYLNGAVLGYKRAEIKSSFEDIIDFAELWEFVDSPIKNYSSGMVARLGFSIATVRRPDILIVDEILGVGDFKFKEKCEKRMNEIISNGTTVILVSHDIKQIRKMCNKVIWLEKGRPVMYGDTEVVCNKYINNY